MTVATTTNSYTYNGTGSTTVFAFNSVFLDAADLKVILTSSAGVETVQTITTHYTVSGGSGSTGSVTMVTAPAVGEKLTIVRDPAQTQALDLVANDPLPAEELEQALDKAVMLLQRVAERIDRSVVIQDSDTGTLTLPVAADRASKYLSFDASGNVQASTGPTGDSTIPVSTYIETLLDDANAAAAQTTLGGTTVGKAVFTAASASAAQTTLGLSPHPVGSVTAYAGSTAPSGWLLLNGDTMGDAGSGATRASADYETLYTLIYDNFADSEAAVSSGRGASAAADWAAGKTITLPDATGRAIFGKESSATRLTSGGAGVDGATLGDSGGVQTHQLTTSELAAHTHSYSTPPSAAAASSPSIFAGSGGSTTGSTGGDTAHTNLPPALVLSWIIKY